MGWFDTSQRARWSWGIGDFHWWKGLQMHVNLPAFLLKTLGRHCGSFEKLLAALYTVVNKLLPLKLAMCSDDAWELWSTFLTAEKTIYKPNRDRRNSKYRSTKKLLFAYMEYKGNRMCAGRKRAALNVWIRWLMSLESLEDGWNEPSRLLQSGGR